MTQTDAGKDADKDADKGEHQVVARPEGADMTRRRRPPRPMPGSAVLVMAKEPVAGRVKTRLCPPLSLAEAAVLAEACLADTLDAVAGCGAARLVLALEGRPGPWLPPGFTVVAQQGRTLDERLAAAWSHMEGPALQIGMDTPQVTPGLLDECLGVLATSGADAALGAAVDGGWWAIGLRRPVGPEVFLGVPMSTPSTGAEQRRRLGALGCRVVDLPVLRDVDTMDDVRDRRLRMPADAVRRGPAPAPAGGRLMAGRSVARWPGALYDDPAGTAGTGGNGPAGVTLRTTEGDRLVLDPARWQQPPGPEEDDLLARASGSVLDVGCGPGRHVLALARSGRPVLGIDSSIDAVVAARRRGAPVVRASVWGPVPDAGSWGTVLLLDGNIGIGGNPLMLLSRVRELLGPGGRVLAEVEGPDVPGARLTVRVEHAGRPGDWFPWARVSAAQVDHLAEVTGYARREVWPAGGRWWAELGRRPAGPPVHTVRPGRPGARPALRLVAGRPPRPPAGAGDGRAPSSLSHRRG